MTQSITFVNQSGLPVMVESWQEVTFGLNELTCQLVRDNVRVTLHSITDEWYLNCMFDDSRDTQAWRDQGLKHVSLGQFSSTPNIDGSYQLMDQEDVGVEYRDGVFYVVRYP